MSFVVICWLGWVINLLDLSLCLFVCSLSLLCFSSYVHKFVVFSRLFKALGLRDVEFSGSEPKANHPTPTSLPFTAFTNLQNKFRQDESKAEL